MTGPDGRVWPNRHRHDTWHVARMICFRMDGDDDGSDPMLVTITLTTVPGGTVYVHEVIMPSEAALQGARAMGAERLGRETLAKLATGVEGLQTHRR